MRTKITFLGDIMCEPLVLKASRNGKEYDFDRIFENVRDLLNESDVVIGNLETPLAGESAGYTSSLLSFNAPDEFADSVKKAGISVVTTANNHCLDRGIEGLIRTTKVLKNKGILCTGTYESNSKREEAVYIKINDITFGILSYTYGTNFSSNHIMLNEKQQKLVNLLRPQDEMYFIPHVSVKNPIYKKIIKHLIYIYF